MKKIILVLSITLLTYSCQSGKHAEFEKNTEAAKAFFKHHEEENAEAMFEYLHPDIEWHLPVYGMELGGIDEVKAAIVGYQTEFDNLKFTADYWLPGVDTETGVPDGSTRVYGTWNSTHTASGKEAKLTTYHSFEFKDGKIINGGDWFDLGGMMNTLVPPNFTMGSLIGIHSLTIKLKKGVTLDQFVSYFKETMIPSFKNEYKGANLHLIEGVRGENKGSLGMIWIFDSEATRNLYYDEQGASTPLNIEIGERLQAVNDGLAELGTWTSQYTDWSVK